MRQESLRGLQFMAKKILFQATVLQDTGCKIAMSGNSSFAEESLQRVETSKLCNAREALCPGG